MFMCPRQPLCFPVLCGFSKSLAVVLGFSPVPTGQLAGSRGVPGCLGGLGIVGSQPRGHSKAGDWGTERPMDQCWAEGRQRRLPSLGPTVTSVFLSHPSEPESPRGSEPQSPRAVLGQAASQHPHPHPVPVIQCKKGSLWCGTGHFRPGVNL